MNTTGERLRIAREMSGFGQVEFAKLIGIEQSNLSSIERGKRGLGVKLLNIIRERTRISVEWLSAGSGEIFRGRLSMPDRVRAIMYKERKEPIHLAQDVGLEYSGEILDVVMHDKEPSDSLLSRIKERMPQYTFLVEAGEDVVERSDGAIMLVKLIPDTVHSGIKPYAQCKEFEKAQALAFTFSQYDGELMAKSVMDDSMEPLYMVGDKLLIKEKEKGESILWNHTYLIDTKSRILVCRPIPGRSEGVILCRFVNPEYPPIEVKVKSILSMFLVVGSIRYR